MNKREKILVVLLAAIIILLGGLKLFIEPKLTQIEVVKASLQQARGDKQQAQLNKIMINSETDNSISLQQKIDELSVEFFPELDYDMIQLFFQDFAVRSNIKYKSFTMVQKTTSKIEIQKAKDLELKYPAKEAADQLNEEKNKEQQETQESQKVQQPAKIEGKSDFVEIITVQMQFESNYNQVRQLLDFVSNSKRTISINSIQLKKVDNDIITVSITANCYGVVKIVEDDLSNIQAPAVPKGKDNPFR